MDTRVKEIIDQSKSVVFFGGAGVSTESGIPDFRSEDGLYRAVSQYGHPPETMISHSFFMEHTETFYKYYKQNLIYQGAKPNKAHKTLAKLEKEGKLTGVVTQNIDGLHQAAGSRQVYELHGSVLRNFCMDCGAPYDLGYILDPENCSGQIPVCKKCGGVIKPDVVLYEEPLDETVMAGAAGAISAADTLIVGGTSLVVYPAAGLIHYFRGKTMILINKTETPYDSRADLVIHNLVGKILEDC